MAGIFSASVPSKESHLHDGVEIPGNLEQLNSLLVKYIKMVKDMEGQHNSQGFHENKTTVNVNIDRSHLTSVGAKFETELENLRTKYRAKDEEIGFLLAKVAQLEADIKLLKKSNSDSDVALRDKNININKLLAEIGKLQASLNLAQNMKGIFEDQLKNLREKMLEMTSDLNMLVAAYSKEKESNTVLVGQLMALEKEMMFKVSVLSSELEIESITRNFDMSSIDSKLMEKYKKRQHNQVQLLEKMYEQHLNSATMSLETSYKIKISGLQEEIQKLQATDENDEEIQLLQIQLESCGLKLSELETNNFQLEQKKKELEKNMEVKREFFIDQESAKEREWDIVRAENEEIKTKYQILINQLDLSQVKNYTNILKPEIERVSGQFASETFVNNRKIFNLSLTESSEFIVKEMKETKHEKKIIEPTLLDIINSSSSDSE